MRRNSHLASLWPSPLPSPGLGRHSTTVTTTTTIAATAQAETEAPGGFQRQPAQRPMPSSSLNEDWHHRERGPEQ
jgi:hypothetical protein